MSHKEIFKRVALSLLAGLLLAVLINEASYRFLKTNQDREPQEIKLVIPAGTAQRVARGEADPSLPASIAFIVGDTLVVKNEDSVNHQLGPLFIPAGASAALNLDTAQVYAYSCSFQPGNYLGLDVREAVTPMTRLVGVLSAGLPMGMLFALYSIVGLSPKKRAAR